MSRLLDIIIPVYNAEQFLDRCLSSIVNCDEFQTYRVVIIDDGSTDSSLDIINEYAKRHSNFFVSSRENKGIVRTLNEAIGLCNAKYIARMDADDIVLPTRFSKQIAYLEENLDVSMIGTCFKVIDENDNVLKISKPPMGMNRIKAYSLFGSPMCHPSIMFRGTAVYGDSVVYQEEPLCEDYCLWLRMLSKFKVDNIDEVGICYRVNEDSISHRNENKQVTNTLRYRELPNFLGVDSESYTSIDNLFAPRLTNLNSTRYLISLITSIPMIIKSKLSVTWFLVYGLSGLLVKLGLRK